METMKEVAFTKDYLRYFKKLIISSEFFRIQAKYHLSSWTSPYENRTIICSLMTSFAHKASPKSVQKYVVLMDWLTQMETFSQIVDRLGLNHPVIFLKKICRN